ncbi:MAG: hypothetical protein MUC84_00805, partial [Solirubrobacteraceae bacterium]|nr:hypothetical protein [Solirubrobacteraceae bacterium]
TSTAVRTITVTPAAAGAGGAPVITALRITPASFAAARRGASVARDTGARVTYTTSRAATTRFTVARRLPGRRVGRRCGAPTRRTRRAPRCTRLARVPGGFTRSDTASRNALRFTGRIGGRALAPGRYRLSATPSAGGISGRAVSAAFRIVR